MDFPLPIVGVFIVGLGIAFIVFRSFKRDKANLNQGEEANKQRIGSKKTSPATRKDAAVAKDQNGSDLVDGVQKQGKKKGKNSTLDTVQLKDSEVKTQKQVETDYVDYYYGTVSLKASNSMHGVTALCIKNSKILLANTKNELILYDLKKWKKQAQNQQRFFTSLSNNNASAVAIGSQFYFAALTFEKTISYYEFKGGEGGVYFREVMKFPRNILKSDASSLYVSESEKYVVSTGSQADTVINVWSMKGERLHQLNSYQIQHYDIKYGSSTILIRGWTSEVKLFSLVNDKDGGFNRIEKSHHLAHSDHPKCSSIDNLGCYTLTISKSNQVTLWTLLNDRSSNLVEKKMDSYGVDLDNIEICVVHTVKDANERLRTIAVLSDGARIRICNRLLKVQSSFEGVECKQIFLVGSMKNVVMATLNKNGKLTVWNITSIVEKIQSYSL